MERNPSWSKLEFPSRQVAAEERAQLVKLFMERFDWLGRPEGMALFAETSPDDFARPAFYFSPNCRLLIGPFLSILDTRDCSPPDERVTLLAGHPGTCRDPEDDAGGLVHGARAYPSHRSASTP
jgi:hypothetical protein